MPGQVYDFNFHLQIWAKLHNLYYNYEEKFGEVSAGTTEKKLS